MPEIVPAYFTTVSANDTAPPVYDAMVAKNEFVPVLNGFEYLHPLENAVVQLLPPHWLVSMALA